MAASGKRPKRLIQLTVESSASEILRMPFLVKRGLRSGFKGTIVYERRGSGFWADIDVDLRPGRAPEAKLRHPPNIAGRQPGPEYAIALVSTPAPYGGVRWWFSCPDTGKRVSNLYLPRGAWRFASRTAHGLVYRTQRMTKLERLRVAVGRTLTRLGAEADVQGVPARPSNMRHKAYRAAVARIAAARRALRAEEKRLLRRRPIHK